MKNDFTGFTKVEHPEPHIGRTKLLLAKYPELRKLFKNTPSTALHIFGLVAAQFAIAIYFRHSPWWIWLIASYGVGAFLSHALWVMIHDATHNLVFKGSAANRVMGMVSNLPLVFPAAMGFRTYHLLHHRFQGEFDRDADLSGPKEAKLFGNTALGKLTWLLNFWFIEGVVRPARLKEVQLWDRWVVINLVVQIVATTSLVYFFGWGALAYLLLSMAFSVGLHPVGARWIQEHYIMVPGQETYSYYGPINWLCYNVGYHNEHHDLMMVPWSRLKEVKRIAPEFYDNLYSHDSWSKLLVRFIFDKELSLYSRVVRESRTPLKGKKLVQDTENASLTEVDVAVPVTS